MQCTHFSNDPWRNGSTSSKGPFVAADEELTNETSNRIVGWVSPVVAVTNADVIAEMAREAHERPSAAGTSAIYLRRP